MIRAALAAVAWSVVAVQAASAQSTSRVNLDGLSIDGFSVAEPGSGSLDWFDTFAFNDTQFGSADVLFHADPADLFEFNTGGRWGFSFGLSGLARDENSAFDLDRLEAGAFFNLTPRFRLGGAVTVTEQEFQVAPGVGAVSGFEDVPELKLESAFKF